MLTIVDYGVGNLYSLRGSLRALGIESCVSGRAEDLVGADRIILPGVGAFGDAKAQLVNTGLVPVLLQQAAAGKPILGICLGMQMLFECSHEYGVHRGLGLLKGEICPIAPDLPDARKVPHMGWNQLICVKESPLLRDVAADDAVYYVHSYYAKGCEDSLVAYSDYGVAIPGLVQKDNVCGAQFHPEKSGRVGLSILKAFAQL